MLSAMRWRWAGRRQKALGALALVAALSAGSSAAASVAHTRASALPAQGTSAGLNWQPCADGECATLQVPLDYSHPKRKSIDVALFRIPATDPSRRIGSLIMNPGGPGEPGTEFLRMAAPAIPAEIRARFDVIGIDPRGTGGTIPVDCHSNLANFVAQDVTPDTPAERTKVDNAFKQFARACGQNNRGVLPFISTENTARDMDRVRQALGDAQLTYVGLSYGTYLGTLYANLFPKNVRAMVLDGAVDPKLNGVQFVRAQAVGFEQSLDSFLSQCSQDPSCPFSNGGDAAGAFDRLAAQVHAQPLVAPNGRTLGPGEFYYAVPQALYSGANGYQQLADALAAAQQGDATKLLALSDEYTGRHPDGTYDPLLQSYMAISCVDGPRIGDANAFRAAEPKLRAAAPRFGVAELNQYLACAYWPVRPVKRSASLRAEGAPPIVVVGTTHDPATPYNSAEALSKDLSSGDLVTVEGTRHTAFLFNGCVQGVVTTYLSDLTAPPPGTRC
jgi:pimeloyl-ACP methyl ester carboxylesterase